LVLNNFKPKLFAMLPFWNPFPSASTKFRRCTSLGHWWHCVQKLPSTVTSLSLQTRQSRSRRSTRPATAMQHSIHHFAVPQPFPVRLDLYIDDFIISALLHIMPWISRCQNPPAPLAHPGSSSRRCRERNIKDRDRASITSKTLLASSNSMLMQEFTLSGRSLISSSDIGRSKLYISPGFVL
jgi:hypothetical protein